MRFKEIMRVNYKEKVMDKTTRNYSLCVGMATLLLTLTANFALAQNLTGMGTLEPETAMSADMVQDSGPFVSVSMTQVNPTENVTMGGSPVNINYMPESSNYTLGKLDVIEISVARHTEVSGQFIINNEGKIQYEFLGDITIEGMKKDEVKAMLTERLSEFIIAPEVLVKIVGYNSKIVYVVGEVGAPGKIFMRGDTITVREALIQAGLPLLTGKMASSRVITPSDTGKIERKGVNVYKLLYEGDLRENLVMKPGDTLYIPPTIMAKALRIIQPVAAPVKRYNSKCYRSLILAEYINDL